MALEKNLVHYVKKIEFLKGGVAELQKGTGKKDLSVGTVDPDLLDPLLLTHRVHDLVGGFFPVLEHVVPDRFLDRFAELGGVPEDRDVQVLLLDAEVYEGQCAVHDQYHPGDAEDDLRADAVVPLHFVYSIHRSPMVERGKGGVRASL